MKPTSNSCLSLLSFLPIKKKRTGCYALNTNIAFRIHLKVENINSQVDDSALFAYTERLLCFELFPVMRQYSRADPLTLCVYNEKKGFWLYLACKVRTNRQGKARQGSQAPKEVSFEFSERGLHEIKCWCRFFFFGGRGGVLCQVNWLYWPNNLQN